MPIKFLHSSREAQHGVVSRSLRGSASMCDLTAASSMLSVLFPLVTFWSISYSVPSLSIGHQSAFLFNFENCAPSIFAVLIPCTFPYSVHFRSVSPAFLFALSTKYSTRYTLHATPTLPCFHFMLVSSALSLFLFPFLPPWLSSTAPSTFVLFVFLSFVLALCPLSSVICFYFYFLWPTPTPRQPFARRALLSISAFRQRHDTTTPTSND